MDFFLVDDPLRAVAVTLAVPAAVILVANLALGLAGIGLSLPRALALAVGMAVLTSPVAGAGHAGRRPARSPRAS